MTDSPPDSDPDETSPRRGEALDDFVQLLDRLAAGERVDLERYCAERPELAAILRSAGPSTLPLLGTVLSALAETVAIPPEGTESSIAQRVAEIRSSSLPRTRYRDLGELSRGGMGSIRRVWDKLLHRELAMKLAIGRRGELLHFTRADSHSRLLRFLQEAEITARLDHPGVVPVHEVGVDDTGHLYFTMHLVRGEDLDRILRRHRGGDPEWTRTRILGVLSRACEAIAFAHSQGVIHRDLKPANIMVGDYGEAYVMDWGLARGGRSPDGGGDPGAPEPAGSGTDFGVRTVEGTVMGTPCYMPPEQAEGKVSELGPAADVYAMGAILYELLAGAAPYADGETSGPDVIARIRRGPPAPLAGLGRDAPGELVAICEKAMARDPSRRYPTMRELSSDLRAFLELRVVSAYRTGPLAELWKWVQRNRAVAVSAAAGLLAVILGALGVAEAERSKRWEVTLSGDSGLHSVLIAEFSELWPPGPSLAPRMEDWIERAESMLGRGAQHRERLADWSNPDRPDRAPDRFSLERERTLVSGLEMMEDLRGGPLAKMRARHDLSRSLAVTSLESEEAVAAWTQARAEIRAHPLFDGYELPLQLGLFPLGTDRDSGLWEFWHIASGARPVRDEGSGRWLIAPETGLVLVLVPGGEVSLGAIGFPAELAGPPIVVKAIHDTPLGRVLGLRVEDRIVAIGGEPVASFDDLERGGTRLGPGDLLRIAVERQTEIIELSAPIEHRFDFFAEPDESPVHELALEPFFISKYEMTRAQWLRLEDARSALPSGVPGASSEADGLSPIAEVDWFRSEALLGDFDLELPTEAQWERAARGGTDSIGWHGNDYSRAALLPRYHYVTARPPSGTVPISALPPNPYGLHGVLGNVWEWCRDFYGSYELGAEPGTGERIVPPGQQTVRSARGGSWLSRYFHIRSADRNQATPAWVNYAFGVRPARRVMGTDGTRR